MAYRAVAEGPEITTTEAAERQGGGSVVLSCPEANNRWCQRQANGPWGNRVVMASQNVAVGVGPLEYDGNNHIVGWEYDGGGNLTRDGLGQMYKYDAEERQTEAGTARYAYDGEGRRVKKEAGGVATVYVYDAFGRLAAEYGGAPAASGRRYLTTDHLGTVRVVTDQAGAVQERHDYLPYGEEILATAGDQRLNVPGYGGTSEVTLRFTGKERDGETGLDYFGARYYSSAQGRFTSPDQPLIDQNPADPQSWNLYTYARNNPLRYVDPTGMAFCSYSSGSTPEGGPAIEEKACTEGGGTWVYQPTDTDDPNADASAFQFSVTKTENTGELSASGQEFFQGNAQLWNNTAGAVNTAAVATGAVLTLPVVVPAAATAAGNAVGFGYGLSTLGGTGIVLGRFPTYIQAARTMGATALNMPNWLYRGLDAIGEGWTANRVYIDTAVRLGKQIYLSNNPGGQGGSIFAQELRYLQTRWGITPSTLPRTLPIR